MEQSSVRPTDDVEEILNKYGDALYRLCVLMLKNESDAEDAVQETLIRYFLKAPRFRDGEHEKAWLIRVAKNQCYDQLRLRKRYVQLEDEAVTERSYDLPDEGIFEALTRVPEKYRIVLILYYVEGYRIEEIAKMIQRSASAVKMRLQKGRVLLEKQYREECF